MRVAFVMRSVGYFRNFEWVVRRLAERGHDVALCFDRVKVAGDFKQQSSDRAAQEQLDEVIRDHPERVRARQFSKMHLKTDSLTALASRRVQLMLDYLRYCAPEFATAHKLRDRAGQYLKPSTRRRIDWFGRRGWGRSLAGGVLSGLLRLIPPREYIVDILREEKADLLMVTPLVGFGEGQVDYFKAARLLGLRTCLPVASWDNLTSKGMMHARPGSVLVWNDAQKLEAIRLHRMDPDRVTVTGAHSYEHWFTWQPTTDKAAFCRRVGLDPGRDYVVFLCSSSFIAADELPVVMRWAKALRASENPALAGIGILIRPHPYNLGAWATADLSVIGNATIFPEAGANPVSREAKSDYFDSMIHCRAVVGVNTSAMIEASILGKPVHTVLFPETAVSQSGTLHFTHLSDAEGGLVRVADDLDEHLELLGRSLANPAEDERRSRAFVERFVWPEKVHDDGAVACFVDALEAEMRAPAPSPEPRFRPLIWIGRVLASPLLLIYRGEYRPIAERARGAERERLRRLEAKTKKAKAKR